MGDDVVVRRDGRQQQRRKPTLGYDADVLIWHAGDLCYLLVHQVLIARYLVLDDLHITIVVLYPHYIM